MKVTPYHISAKTLTRKWSNASLRVPPVACSSDTVLVSNHAGAVPGTVTIMVNIPSKTKSIVAVMNSVRVQG